MIHALISSLLFARTSVNSVETAAMSSTELLPEAFSSVGGSPMSSKHLPIAQLERRKINVLESGGSISNRIDISAPSFINAHFQLIVINDL